MKISMGEDETLTPEEFANRGNSPGVEFRGKSNESGSVEDILGLNDARGFTPESGKRPGNPHTDEVMGKGASPESNEDVAELKAELERMRRKEGDYGRQVVGPLRAENEELRSQLNELKGQFEEFSGGSGGQRQNQTQDVDPRDLVPLLLGPDADPEDPESLRLARLGKTLLQASEQGTQSYVSNLEQKLDQLGQRLESAQALSQSGFTQEEVQQAEQKFPELKDLPDSRKVSLLRRLRDEARGTPPRDEHGRFQPRGAAPSGRPNPEDVVEGSNSTRPPMGSEDSDDRFDRFQSLARDRKKGGAKAATSVFLDMVESGAFD